MSDLVNNLVVLTDHLGDLAEMQQTAANQITGANRAVGDLANSVQSTHGIACWSSISAVRDAEEARDNAGQTMYNVSTELAEKLTTSATNYNNADYRSGEDLGGACQV